MMERNIPVKERNASIFFAINDYHHKVNLFLIITW